MSRIEQLMDEIEQYIESCKYQPLSSTKIIVNKEEIDELLTELRLKAPGEIERYRKIISNKDAIIADAQAKAEAIVKEAEAQSNKIVNEHEIVQQAYNQANAIVEEATKQAQAIIDSATMDANNIRMGAIRYTDDMLNNLQSIISYSFDDTKNRYENLMKALNQNLEIVTANRAELKPQIDSEEPEIEEEISSEEE